MQGERIADLVRKLALPVTEAANLELVDVEYLKEGGSWFLRLYIDKPGGVGMEDCSLVSRQVGDLLDERDPIPGQYHLEVSSPGLDRPLKQEADYLRFKGSVIAIRTYKPLAGKRVLVGRLQGVQDGVVELGLEEGQVIRIPRENIAKANLNGGSQQ